MFPSIRQLVTRYSQAAKARRSPKTRKDLSRRVAYRCFFEQLESRIVPSTLTPDKTGFAPGETAALIGAGFQAGETIDLHVVRGDGTSYAAWAVTDGGAGDRDGVADGNISTSWTLPDDAP